jgi:hypothetical protein
MIPVRWRKTTRRGCVACATTAVLAALVATASSAGAPTAGLGPIFRGDGGKTLPPFTVRVGSTLRWANNGGIFQLFASGTHGSVNSQAHNGWTYLPPGRYKFQVNAIGSWTIKIDGGAVAPRRLSGGWLGYSGNGGLELPPFHSRSGSLKWKNSGSIFQIFSDDFSGGGDVNSQAHSGSTYLSAGTHRLTVNAIGSWTITWRG